MSPLCSSRHWSRCLRLFVKEVVETCRSLILFTKTNLYIAETDDIAICNLSRFTVSYAATVDVCPVGRACVGDQQCAFTIHHQRGMNLRDALVVKIEIVIGAAP